MKLLTMLMIAAAFALTGCNTMSGLGEDIQRGGDKLLYRDQGLHRPEQMGMQPADGYAFRA
jgi:predicted small secreted protein